MLGRFRPRIVAAHGLQVLLLVTAVAAVTLGAVLVLDLVSGMRSVAITEAENSLTAALHDLSRALGDYPHPSKLGAADPEDRLDRELRLLSYQALRPHSLVEGGFLIDGLVLGHSFPEHTEPGSRLYQPKAEREAMLAAAEASRLSGDVGHHVFTDSTDLVVVSALVDPNMPAASWALKRFINFGDPNQTRHRLALAALVAISLSSVGGVLFLSLRLQRGFAEMKSGLERMRTDLSFRLPEQNHELKPIAHAINEMAVARETIEAELRREDQLRLMGRLMAGIAHEIKNPLNSVRIMMQGLGRVSTTPALVQNTAADVISEIDRLNALLRNLLAFRGDCQPALRRQSVSPIVQRCVSIVAPQAKERSIDLGYRADEDSESLFDADGLQQAVLNLLLNALDAAGEHGWVRLTVSGASGAVAVRIEDSGPGLSPEQKSRVFEPFYSTKANGAGLGLTITKSLVERMGGSVEYAGRGAGGAFEIRLPRS